MKAHSPFTWLYLPQPLLTKEGKSNAKSSLGYPTQLDEEPIKTRPFHDVDGVYVEMRRYQFVTGITVDLERRLEEHSKGKEAKYIKHREPYTLVFNERQETRGQALKREAAIKAMTREGKLVLIKTR